MVQYDIKGLGNQHLFGMTRWVTYDLDCNLNSPPETVYHAYLFWNSSLKIYGDYIAVYISGKVHK